MKFAAQDRFRLSSSGYRLLPFRFMRWSQEEIIVVNEVGEHIFLDTESFQKLHSHDLSPCDDKYLALKSKHFLYEEGAVPPVALLATKYRTKRSFLNSFTALHMFVVTLRCDHSCPYCQVSRVSVDRSRYDMSLDTARKAVNLMFCSPSPYLKVEFQGGEPLLNMSAIHFIVDYVTELNQSENREIEFVVATNLAFLDEGILEYLKEHCISVSTSLDGPAQIHNANRPRPGGNSHEITARNIRRAKRVLGDDRVSALMTTSNLSLGYPKEIVEEYARLGFREIFLRPVSPYGFASRSFENSQQSVDRFLVFYQKALEYIIELNRNGKEMTEVFAQILLRKILTPFSTGYVDLQSPSGAVIGGIAYNYDGSVYASDEARMLAEMGDHSFRLGDVHENGFGEIFGGPVARLLVEDSCVEALPGCEECAFQSFCGADPILHHATQGDHFGHRPTSQFCSRNMSIIKYLLELYRSGDRFIEELFTSWATRIR